LWLPVLVGKMADVELSDKNRDRLLAVQKVMSVEEGEEADLDTALTRILDFYRVFVPYN